MTSLRSIKRALISVYNKTGIEILAKFLHTQGIIIISSGGTASYLRKHDIPITDLATLARNPEILGGRVKSLSSYVHASILCDRENPQHMSMLNKLDIAPVDLVVVNFYPADKLEQNTDYNIQKLVENIDIGGPALMRAAAKNYCYITILSSPDQYQDFEHIYEKNSAIDINFRQSCAKTAFSCTAYYDLAISNNLHHKICDKNSSLRYGENPHQKAALISRPADKNICDLTQAKQLNGKTLSYNNYLDTNAGILALRALDNPKIENLKTCVIIKHGVACGAAQAQEQVVALKNSYATDPKSAFGGVVIISHELNSSCAQIINNNFFEVVLAPKITTEALEILKTKKNLRILVLKNLLTGSLEKNTMRSILGGILIQEQDMKPPQEQNWEIVTKKYPDDYQSRALQFSWRLARITPSNAMVLSSDNQLFGVGAGQPNRIQSLSIAHARAQENNFDLSQAVLASDGFFPFSDCIEFAHKSGIGAIIQPGGSINDQKIIQAANQHKLVMIFTHSRHFKH